MVDREKFPQTLQIAREAAGLTQSELGERLGRTQQAVAMWENGSSFPSKKSMEALKKVLPELGPQKPSGQEAEHKEPDTYTRTVKTARIPHGAIFSLGKMEHHTISEIEGELPKHLQENFKRLRAIDYFSDKLALEISVWLPTARPVMSGLAMMLWRLSSMRLQFEEGPRQYGLLVLALNSEPYMLQNRLLAKLTYEASLHGLFVKVVGSPKEAAEFIAAVESGAVTVLTDVENEDVDTDEP